jgi:hypothetical protein
MREEHRMPFFVPTPVRPLTATEREILERLLEGQAERYRSQASNVAVVGRCGCGSCPTIFFAVHHEGDRETDLVSSAGRDASGGLVGVLLLEKEGSLSQLEFFSMDGHHPWGVPGAETLEP